ncbi:3TM-type holin [Azospirillum sp. TSA6c]|uniref:3TM-type holin n=1 Tax=unclassified Azospirillum TaxID=2630922 RepID=UPI001FFEF4D7|nr:3TM-type holin [Azospirillum sp. TSA6c]
MPDPDAKAKATAAANAQMVAMLQTGDTSQLQVNAAEAANPSLFVSGWRPAVG